MKIFHTSIVSSFAFMGLVSVAMAGELASRAELYEGPEFERAMNNPVDNPDLPNVLLIGDSISIGYTVDVRKQLHGKADVFRIPSNGRNARFGLKNLEKWIGERRWDVIHFNWGLWDICYRNPKSKEQGHRDKIHGTLTETPEAYRELMTAIFDKLKTTDATLIWCTTTPVPEHEAGRKLGDEMIYNRIVEEIASANGVLINDLHAHALRRQATIMKKKGDVHFTRKGYAYLAEKVAEVIETQLQGVVAAPPVEARERVVRLWPIERVGGEANRLKEVYRDRNGQRQLCGVKDPNLTIYPGEGVHPRPAVLFVPGGGYGILGLPSREVIQAWQELGVTLLVLKYTIPKQPELAYQDLQRAVRLVRHHAEQWKIDPERIGLFGNSAGGHLSARLMHNFDQPAYPPVDAIDAESCSPDFAVLQCAAYFNGIPFVTKVPLQKATELDRNWFHFRNPVAPTFLTYAKNDPHYPGGTNYVEAMHAAGHAIHFEVFETGGHGMANCDWFTPMVAWLQEQGCLDEK